MGSKHTIFNRKKDSSKLSYERIILKATSFAGFPSQLLFLTLSNRLSCFFFFFLTRNVGTVRKTFQKEEYAFYVVKDLIRK